MDNKPGLANPTTKRIAHLIARYFYNDLSTTEQVELDQWMNESKENRQIFLDATDKERLLQGLDFIHEADIESKLAEIKIKGKLEFTPPAKRIRLASLAVAASILLVVCSTIFLIYKNENTRTNNSNDILPGSVKAVLTLSNGDNIILENEKDGPIATDGKSTIEKQNGFIEYKAFDNNDQTNISYNTITTPAGGTHPLMLSDGTKIWLNNLSSIRFPTVFIGQERRVSIEGEAFFEVAKNPGMPFRVEVKGKNMLIEVVGTQFNVNAYPEQDSAKITLLEGEIKLIKESSLTTLKPDQEARVPTIGKPKLLVHPDTQTSIAWKNETFRFDNNDIPTIMKQISRWYEINIIYKSKIPDKKFGGTIPRNIKLSQVLRILELNGVHCSIKERNLIVSIKE